MAIDFRLPTGNADKDPTFRQQQPASQPGLSRSTFGLLWWVQAIHLVAAAALAFILTMIGVRDEDPSAWFAVLMGGGLLLTLLCCLPASLGVDARGVHQYFMLGLWARSIPREEILGYRVAQRGDLRKAGLIGPHMRRRNITLRNDYQSVVWVGSSREDHTLSRPRYLLHTLQHRDRKGWVRALRKAGIPRYRL